MSLKIDLASRKTKDLLITVPQKLAEKILSGEKQVEFRKLWPATQIRRVFFCQKASGGSVVARADVFAVDVCSPDVAWKRYKSRAGVNADEFIAYCGVHSHINCVVLRNAQKITDTRISDWGLSIAPQNYIYLGQ